MANNPTIGYGYWSILAGTCDFTDISTATTTITNVGEGENILRWTVANSNCPSATNDVIINYENIIAEFTVTPETQIYPNATVGIENYSNPNYTSYYWEFDDGNTLTQDVFEAFFEHEYTSAGTYTITLTAYGDFCENSTAQTITILDEVSIQNTENNLFQIYPNPSNGVFEIENNTNDNIYLEILNIEGKIIYTSNFNNKTKIDLSNYSKGIYFIKLNSNNETYYKKIIIQ